MNIRERKWTDEDILEVLALRDVEGLTYLKIANSFGTTRSAIAGLIRRVEVETRAHFPTCDQEQTLPPRWWKQRNSQ